MDTLTKVLNLVQKNDWAISFDLKDAYFHIGIFKKHRKFLRFAWKGKVFQFKTLCFGPTVSPRVFTKILSVVAAYLRVKAIRLAVYLDDWIQLNQERQILLTEREITLNLLLNLGFIINKNKSTLIPVQILTYLGTVFQLKKGLVYPTAERFQKLVKAMHLLINGYTKARQYLVVLGMMASTLEIVPNARLYMRPLQMHLLRNWSPARMSLHWEVPCTQSVKSSLHWWLHQANFQKGVSLQPIQPQITMTCDASMVGWGGFVNNQVVQGVWSRNQSTEHINYLELKAVHLSLENFVPILKNKHVLIRSDNSSTVQYLNKQGGTKSMRLCELAQRIWFLALHHNMKLKSVHIKGQTNVLADFLSRHQLQATEWSLNKTVVNHLFWMWETPLIDLFATAENKQCPVFCSWNLDTLALTQDALSISWEGMMAYAFPPISLLGKVLKHMMKFQCELILIAPMWERQHWYPMILQLLIAPPVKLPEMEDLLVQKGMLHPNPKFLKLTAWRLSTNGMKQKDFLDKLENYCVHHGESELRKIIDVNLGNSIAGVVKDKLIPLVHL
ncbi:uncharacterized protein LOC127842674 isoform X1 [Dreissena polymorpha]|uniref:uncharacterized protein LOC127842674 isoform X1 n=1 Tax=Dreissena polymorpha TaxID=45954 RepID=UPI002263F637|nr:uncharacterized protein LOC127842674 isoform X1 [Dreissena polymorpha]